MIARDHGIKLLIDGRFEDLEAEMRRVSDPSRPTVEGYYFTEKRDGVAHVTDAPLATMETFVKEDLRISAEDIAIIFVANSSSEFREFRDSDSEFLVRPELCIGTRNAGTARNFSRALCRGF